MAKRRMFSLDIVDTDTFLDMPASTQALYFHLGMRADDDGFVASPRKITTMVNCSNDDLKLLLSKGFIIPFDSGVCLVRDWKINNQIRLDRYKPTQYLTERQTVKLTENGAYIVSGIPNDNQMGDIRETQVRLGKDRLERESTTRARVSTPPLDKYGPYGWVKLSKEQYGNLVKEIGERETKRCIDYVDESAQATGNKNKWKDWNLVVRKCHRQKWGVGEKPAITPEVIPSEEPEIIDGHLVCGGKRMWEV